MDSKLPHVISLLDMHAELTEFQSKQLLQMASRADFSKDDREMLKAMGRTDSDTAAALRNSIAILRQLEVKAGRHNEIK